MDTVIHIRNLTKTYRMFSGRRLLAAQPLLFLTRNSKGHTLHALQDVSFEVQKGEIFGIIGHNGSGKSTLLKIMSGITRADKGDIVIKGRVTSLLELGVGFEPELTGRENLYLYGALVGMHKHEVAEKEDMIIRFSGIRTFIDAPVKTYSSGMLIRLAFAAAIHTDPDVLLLDEVLGVGDDEFRHRSFQAIQKAVEKGTTVVLVSHGLSMIGNFCSRVMCLNQGRVAGIGAAEQVVQIYMDRISAQEKICELESGNLKLRFLPTGFHIEHSGIVYTVARGLSVNLLKWEADFLSSEAAWTILEQRETDVILQLRWGHWNLDQTWHVKILDDRTIDWTIENGPRLHQDVDSLQIEAMVSSAYQTYILPEDYRAFPRTDNRGFNMEYLLAQQQPRRFLGVTAPVDGRYTLILDFSRSPLTGSAMIITGGNLMPGHIIHRSFAAQPDQKSIHTRIHLFDEPELHHFYQQNRKKLSVSAGQVELKLENGFLMLYVNDELKTRKPGLHVAWLGNTGSMQYEWESIENETGLHLRATDCHAPVVSVWTLDSRDGNVCWSVELEILEMMDISNVHVVLPLLEAPDDHTCYGSLTDWHSSTCSLTTRPARIVQDDALQFTGRLKLASGCFIHYPGARK
jgi:ABC-type polysaccharide/polyol phosphate transport system ATPase subunit